MADTQLLGSLRDIIIIVDSFKSAFTKYSQENLRQQAIGLNRKLINVFEGYQKNLLDIPGRIVFGLETVMTAQEEGFRNVGKSTLMLATEQRLTNQFSPRLYQVLKQVGLYTGLSIESQDELSKSILKTSLEYGVLTGKLTGAIENLLPLIETLGPLGIRIEEASTRLIGKLGPAVEVPLVRFMKEFLDPSMQAYQKLGIISNRLLQLRAEFTRSIDVERKSEIIQEAAIEVNNRFLQLQKQVGIPDLLFGFTGQSMAFNKNLLYSANAIINSSKEAIKGRKGIDALAETQRKFNESWGVLGLEIFDPIKIAALNLGTVLLEGVNKIPTITKALGSLTAAMIALGLVLKAATVVEGISIKRQEAAIAARAAAAAGVTPIVASTFFKGISGFIKILGWAGLIFAAADILSSIFAKKGVYSLVKEDILGFGPDNKLNELNVKNVEVDEFKTKSFKIPTEDLLSGYLDLFDQSVHKIISTMRLNDENLEVNKRILESSIKQEILQSDFLRRNRQKHMGGLFDF